MSTLYTMTRGTLTVGGIALPIPSTVEAIRFPGRPSKPPKRVRRAAARRRMQELRRGRVVTCRRCTDGSEVYTVDWHGTRFEVAGVRGGARKARHLLNLALPAHIPDLPIDVLERARKRARPMLPSITVTIGNRTYRGGEPGGRPHLAFGAIEEVEAAHQRGWVDSTTLEAVRRQLQVEEPGVLLGPDGRRL